MNTNSNSIDKSSVLLVDSANSPSLQKYGVSFHWWSAEPTSLHCHNFYEIFFVTRGSVLHEYNGRIHELPTRSLCLLRPGDIHRISPAPDLSCMHMNLCITPAHFNRLLAALSLSKEDFLEEKSCFSQLDESDATFFFHRAEQINLLLHGNDHRVQPLICELLSEALCALFRSREEKESRQPIWFTRLLQQIHSPDNLSITASQVYDLSNFSAPVIIACFRLYTGKTVCEYLRDMKMRHACSALSDTDISPLELSNLLGYASLSHFSRIFKETTGMPPAAYRKEKNRKEQAGTEK